MYSFISFSFSKRYPIHDIKTVPSLSINIIRNILFGVNFKKTVHDTAIVIESDFNRDFSVKSIIFYFLRCISENSDSPNFKIIFRKFSPNFISEVRRIFHARGTPGCKKHSRTNSPFKLLI